MSVLQMAIMNLNENFQYRAVIPQRGSYGKLTTANTVLDTQTLRFVYHDSNWSNVEIIKRQAEHIPVQTLTEKPHL